MQQLKIYQIDAFADNLFAGNPAAVVPLTRWLPDHLLQAIAAENNLSETAFLVPIEKHFHLRWFTPLIEVDLCGHATLASAHYLWEHADYSKNIIKFETRSGILTVHKNQLGYAMNFPIDNLEKMDPDPRFGDALGCNVKAIFRGNSDYLCVINSVDELKSLTPDFTKLKAISARGIIVTAKDEEFDFVSRGFFPQCGIDEDPVTGSAHTTLSAYWSKILGKTSMTGFQASHRGGKVICQIDANRVILIGRAITYLEGTIFVPVE